MFYSNKKYSNILGNNIEFDNHMQSTWSLIRNVLRKQKIERIYGTKNTDRKEKF